MKPEKYYQMIRIQLKCMIMLNKSMTLEFHGKLQDSLNKRYQIDQKDNYIWSTKDKSCYGCFAAGINFRAV